MNRVYTPTSTPYGGGDAELGMLSAMVTLVLLTLVVGLAAGGLAMVTRYATGLTGGSRVVGAASGRSPRPIPSSPFRGSSVGFELLVYEVLGIVFVVGLFAVGFPVAQAVTEYVEPTPTTAWYAVGFVGVVCGGAAAVLSRSNADAGTARPVLLSLAAELGVFGLVTGTVLLTLFRTASVSAWFGPETVTILASVAGLAGLSALARRIDVVPGPGERTYAAGLAGLGVTLAVLGQLAVEFGSGGPGSVLTLIGGSCIALGLLAALATVE